MAVEAQDDKFQNLRSASGGNIVLPEGELPPDIAVRIEGVWKRYRTGAIKGGTLVREAQSLLARWRGKEDPNQKIAMDRGQLDTGDTQRNEWFWAVRDVSFEVKKGEVVVILGRNGAGKSTLLQMLCQVTEADRGTIDFRGRFATLLQAGVGFHEELTGRENIFLNGAILGLTRDEIIDRIPKIAEFSEIPQFLDTPVKRYSSGMRGRLGFSVAAHLGAEIMILDEVFATGDRVYRFKCIDKVKELAANGTTILLVTHMVEMLGDAVTRAIYMEDGRICYDGEKRTAISMYLGELSSRLSREEAPDVEAEDDAEQEMLLDHANEVLTESPANVENHLSLARAYLKGSARDSYENANFCLWQAEILSGLQGEAAKWVDKIRRVRSEVNEGLKPLNQVPHLEASLLGRTCDALHSLIGEEAPSSLVGFHGNLSSLARFGNGLTLLGTGTPANRLSLDAYREEGLNPKYLAYLGAKPFASGVSMKDWLREEYENGVEGVLVWVNRMGDEEYRFYRSLNEAVKGEVLSETDEELLRIRSQWFEEEDFADVAGSGFVVSKDRIPLFGSPADLISTAFERSPGMKPAVLRSVNVLLNGENPPSRFCSPEQPLAELWYLKREN